MCAPASSAWTSCPPQATLLPVKRSRATQIEVNGGKTNMSQAMSDATSGRSVSKYAADSLEVRFIFRLVPISGRMG